MLTGSSIHRRMRAMDFPAPYGADANASPAPSVEDGGVWPSECALSLRYVSRWQEQPDPATEKRAFRVYLTSASNADFTVGIRTERSLRCKHVSLRAGKRRCIHLPNHGHRWRLELTCTDPEAWQPSNGISVYLDVDWEQ